MSAVAGSSAEHREWFALTPHQVHCFETFASCDCGVCSANASFAAGLRKELEDRRSIP